MLTRICLIVALLAALAVGVVNGVWVKGKINTLTTDRNTQRSDKITAQTNLKNTKAELVATKSTLDRTRQELAQSNDDRDKAVASETAQRKRADDLGDKLARTSQELDTAQTALGAYKATGFSADQVGKLGRDLKDSQDALDAANQEKIVLNRTIVRLDNQLQKYIGTNVVVKLPANLKGRIVTVDPKWEFVVLNVGQDQGVLDDGELLVSRDGKLVAKVIATRIEKNRCIANIIPGWKLGQVIEGDEVTPAHPAS
jgi:hypothetical protein